MNSVKGTLNSVQLIGRLGRDPELRFTASGAGVCEFSVATRRIAGRNANGEREYATEWITVQVWEKLADVCKTYLRKGRRVMVSGSLRTDSWEDRDSGQRRYRTYVRGYEVMFLDAPNDSSEPHVIREADDALYAIREADDLQEIVTEPETDQDIPF